MLCTSLEKLSSQCTYRSRHWPTDSPSTTTPGGGSLIKETSSFCSRFWIKTNKKRVNLDISWLIEHQLLTGAIKVNLLSLKNTRLSQGFVTHFHSGQKITSNLRHNHYQAMWKLYSAKPSTNLSHIKESSFYRREWRLSWQVWQLPFF